MVKFQIQAIDTNEQPLTDANIRVRILAPAKTPWLRSFDESSLSLAINSIMRQI